jgi:predicted nucleotidyltransferase
MAKQAIELMFGAYRRDLLAQLLLRPNEDFHLRELERMTGIPAGSLHRELKALFEAGLLLKERQGNQIRYQANRASPVYEELASIFRKTVGLAGVLSDALADLSGRIDLAFIFGSSAVGRQKYSSDVDLMIIGDISLLEVVKALASAQAKLGREINPVVMTADMFGSQAEKKERFISRVLEEPKIFVIGGANDFAELTEHGAAG